MIIFLHGPDDYRRHERKQFYMREYEKKHSALGMERFDLLRDGAFHLFQAFVRSRSMFDPFKLVIVENVFDADIDELHGELKELVKSGKEITILISESKKPAKAFSFLLKEPVIHEAFETLTGSAWELFVRKVAKEYRVGLTLDALRFLADAYAGDSWRVVTELQKLSFLRERAVTEKDLGSLGVELTPNFWALMNAFKSPDLRRRLYALETVFAENEPAAKTFNILSAQWPERIGDFARYDLSVKSGKMDYEEALVDLAIS